MLSTPPIHYSVFNGLGKEVPRSYTRSCKIVIKSDPGQNPGGDTHLVCNVFSSYSCSHVQAVLKWKLKGSLESQLCWMGFAGVNT